MLIAEREYYKTIIKQLRYDIKKLRVENRLLTGINTSMRKSIGPLEEIYYSENFANRKKDASFKDIVKYIARKLRG